MRKVGDLFLEEKNITKNNIEGTVIIYGRTSECFFDN